MASFFVSVEKGEKILFPVTTIAEKAQCLSTYEEIGPEDGLSDEEDESMRSASPRILKETMKDDSERDIFRSRNRLGRVDFFCRWVTRKNRLIIGIDIEFPLF